jgi:hypothetical protein
MNAVVAVVISLVVVILLSVAITLVVRRNASPAARYRRELRGIRRIRKGIRAGDPNATSIGENNDARIGYATGSVGP